MSESYNVKLIQYKNGTLEIRSYGDLMCADPELELDEMGLSDESIELRKDLRHKKRMLKKEFQEKLQEESKKIYNPFTEEIEILEDMDDIEMQLAHEHSLKSSYNRTIHAIYKYSRQCIWEYFITLTFSAEHVDRYDFGSCMKKANKWFQHQHERYAPELKYLFVPEQHADGAYHIHGLIADTGDIKIEDSGRVSVGGKACIRTEINQDCPTIYNLSGWKFGFSTATKILDTHKVSTYITKYITKDICEMSKNRKRYYRSRNIPEPEETTFIVPHKEKAEFINTLADSLGAELVYEKSFDGYTSVDYRFYQA